MNEFLSLGGFQAAAQPGEQKSAQGSELESAAADFEAIFARQMIASMRSAKLTDGLLDSNAGGTFRDRFDGAVADILGRRGALGIGDALGRELSRRQAPAGVGARAADPEGSGR